MDNVLYYQEKGTGQPFILFQKTEEAKRHDTLYEDCKRDIDSLTWGGENICVK